MGPALFRFPDPVDETSARLVAAGVVAQVVLVLALREGWLLVPLVYGFAARVLTGPTLSPLGQVVTRVLTPWARHRLGVRPRLVAGPPKRFAQGIGLVVSSGAALAWLVGAPAPATAALVVLLVAASLEAFLRICLGCIAHNALWGCADCGDIGERLRQAVARSQGTVATPADGAARRP